MMKALVSKTLLTLLALGLAACANLSTQSRQFEATSVKAITVDASQRSLVAVRKKYTEEVEWTAICTEPSPDALLAFASSGQVSASVAEKALNLAFAQQQSAAGIGLRTQSITLMRDAMYRICEAYASGALDNKEVAKLHRQYQHILLSLLAIEQLTGPVMARQASISNSASATLGISLADLSKALADSAGEQVKAASEAKLADEDNKAMQTTLKTAQDNDKAASTAETKAAVKKAQEDKDAASKKLAAAKLKEKAADKHYESLEKSLADTQKLALSASGKVTFGAVSGGNGVAEDPQSVKVVAKTVKDIVQTIVSKNYNEENCIEFLSQDEISAERKEYLNKFADYCAKLLVIPGGKKALETNLNNRLKPQSQPVK
jgi:hypothetical protein